MTRQFTAFSFLFLAITGSVFADSQTTNLSEDDMAMSPAEKKELMDFFGSMPSDKGPDIPFDFLMGSPLAGSPMYLAEGPSDDMIYDIPPVSVIQEMMGFDYGSNDSESAKNGSEINLNEKAKKVHESNGFAMKISNVGVLIVVACFFLF